jgi:hypothetical protein
MKPIYRDRNWKSMGQEYRVYKDRIELQLLWSLYTMKIPYDDLEIELRPPPVVADLFRGYIPAKQSFQVIKNDFADFFTHVTVNKKSGWWKQIRITPSRPKEFYNITKNAMKEYKSKHHF